MCVCVQRVLTAVDGFAQQVEDLLDKESPKLYKHLIKLLSSQADHDEQSLSHIRLRNIIHLHVQKMLVGMLDNVWRYTIESVVVPMHTGDLPMEVVCYIWDQCFIEKTVQDFQCLKYFITSWFIILKHQLLACQTVSLFFVVVVNHHDIIMPLCAGRGC